MAELAADHDVREFFFSASLAADGGLQQRAAEFLYPRRIVENSKHIFARVQDDMPAGCRLTGTARDITLYECAAN